MSEKLPINNEDEPVIIRPTAAGERPQAAEYSPIDRSKQIEQAQANVAVEAEPTPLPTPAEKTPPAEQPHLIDRSVLNLRLRQSMETVQKNLKPTEKSFSKFVHQPLVSKVSNSAAQTVSRPSGMLGGGIAAFVGSLLYLFLAKHVGFSYNYLLFMVFFVVGFALGVAGEYAAYWLRRISTK